MEGKERSREERQGEIRLNRKPVPRVATQAYIKCFIITLMKPYSIGSYLSGTVFLFIYSYVVCKKQRIRTHPQLGISSDYLCLVGLFIPDLLKGKEPRWTKHIPKGPKMLVFTRNFETRKEYDYGKVHY